MCKYSIDRIKNTDKKKTNVQQYFWLLKNSASNNTANKHKHKDMNTHTRQRMAVIQQKQGVPCFWKTLA